MRCSLLAAVTLAAQLNTPQNAHASNSIDLPACKKVIASISEQTGTTVFRVSDTRDTAYLKGKNVSSIALFCSRYYDPFAYVSSSNREPPAAYYAVFAKVATILFPGAAKTFAAAAIKCQAAALKDDEGTSSAAAGPATLECSVGKADADDDDDRGATSIKIEPRQQ